MTVLFLDADGVVNCLSTCMDGGLFPIDKYMAFLVGRIVDRTGCKVVLSSSWRHCPEAVEEIKKRVCPVYDMTTLQDKETRGEEVQEWLDSHPEVEKHAILDDRDDFSPKQQPSFFKTTFLNGLTDEIADAVIAHLL